MTKVTSDKKILINSNDINNCKLTIYNHQTQTIWDNCIKIKDTYMKMEQENNFSNLFLCPLCRHIGCVNNNCIKLNKEINTIKMRRSSATSIAAVNTIIATTTTTTTPAVTTIINDNSTDDLMKIYKRKIKKTNLNDNYNENNNCVHHNNKEINQNFSKLCLNNNYSNNKNNNNSNNINTPTNAFKLNKKPSLRNVAVEATTTKTTPSRSVSKFLLLKNTFAMIIFMSIIIFLNNLSLCNIYVNGDQIKPSTDLATASESGICQSMDIRNTPSELKNLKGCRVVEGFVQILLIDKYNESEYEQYSFPELQEITDYLLLFRVNGLKSLNKLFPNLSVIRGNKLIKNYALIIYELMHIQEIGLSSLSYIGRGAIRIEKNPMLCYVNSIDWTLIAHNTTLEDHYILGNKKANECPSCPGHGVKSEGGEDKSVTHDCPLSLGDDKRRLCWNLQHCQKICPASCGERACNENGQCCDESCLGGCSGPKLNNCTVCRYFSIGDINDRRCIKTCPANTFQHMGRRCIYADECKVIGKPLDIEEKREHPYIPFNGVCLLKCPVNYNEYGEEFNRTCRPCDGQCKKTCKGANIDSIASAQKLRGCTHIDGSLEIQIRSQGGLNIVKELEQSLSMIEEIDGYLKVVRSFPLLSLNFLKGLKVIHGRVLENTKYALIALDNQNIQDLWDENHNVIIEKGKLFFHFNPKLCFYKIERLKSMVVEKGDFVNEDVARSSNGDKIACNVTQLNVTVKVSYTYAVIIEWEQIQIDDIRNLLGYVVYYIQAPYKNITLYDGRDACGGDGWYVDDINEFPDSGPVNHIITHLTPYTQYAYYVKTYTVAAETTGGQSQILYFRTEPGQPENVQKLKSYTNGSSEIVVQWEPPKKHNGNLTTYIIKGSLMKDDAELLGQRNYCQEPLKRVEQQPPIPEIKPSEEPPTATKDDCDCEKYGGYGRVNKIISEHDAEQQINFEDTLQNWVYIKRYKDNSEPRRRKRNTIVQSNDTYVLKNDDDTPQIFPTNSKNPDSMTPVNSEDTLSRKDKDGYYEYIYQVVNAATTTFVMRNVKHYSSYSISVKACRDRITSTKVDDPCGNEAIIHQRTSKMENADDIVVFNVFVENLNQTLGSVRLTWSEPVKPNSLIVTYTIKYQRVDIEHAKFLYICLSQKQFQNLASSYILSQLDTGNYSVQIMATSLAGDGNYTPPKYFSIDISHSQNKLLFITIGIICFVTLLVGGYFYWRKRYAKPVADLKLIASVNPEYVSMQYTPDEWEVPREKIIQMRELGQGSFGMVYEGIVKNLAKSNAELPCAIKTVNENATDRERINFLKEASVMKAFDTHHVVHLLGVVSRGQPTLVIMELMANGDLKGYLRSHRPDAELMKQSQPPTLKRILQMAIEIADGMAYLSNNKFVHRDLAARNCMVAEDLTVKIGDFGMTRDIYETDYYRKGTKGLLPVRWMSPESLKDGVFTSHSDVFSYGVVLWEMATLASQPYQGLSNDQVLRYVIDGGVMERPENCPDKLYDLMRQCWQHRPSARPTFLQIVENLLNDANPKFREVSYFYSDEGQVNVLAQSPTPIPDDVTTPLRQGDDALSLDVDNYLVNSQNSQHSHHLIVQDEDPMPKLVPAHSPLSGGIGSGIFNDASESQQQQQTSTSGSGSVLYLNNGNNGSVTSHVGSTGPANTANYSQMQQSSGTPSQQHQQPYKQRNIRHTNRNAAAALAAMAASQAAAAAASSATTNENYDSSFEPPNTSNLKDSSGGVIVTIDGDNKDKQLKKSGYYYNDVYIGNQPATTTVPPISTSDNNRPSTSTSTQHNLFPDFLRKMKSKLSYGGNSNDSTNGSSSKSNKKSKKPALISKIPILNKSQDDDDDDDEASGVVSGSGAGSKYKQMKRKTKANTTSNSGSGSGAGGNSGNGSGGATGLTDRKKSIPSQTQLMHDKDRLENGVLSNALVSVYDNDDDDDINIDDEDDYDDGFYDVMHSKKNLNQDAGADYSYDGGKTASLLPSNLNYTLTPTKTILGKSVASSSSGGVGVTGGGNNSGGSSSIGSDIRNRKHDFLVHNNS